MIKNIFTCILIMFVVLGCSKSQEGENNAQQTDKSGIFIPDIKKECKNGQCIDGQWETVYQRFAIVVADRLNLRAKPVLDSSLIVQLPITRKVTVLYRKQQKEVIDGQTGSWVFIRDADNISIKGWVFDRYLGFINDFKKVSSLRIKAITVQWGHTIQSYSCSSSAKCSIKYSSSIKGKEPDRTGVNSGEIYKYKNVLWFKKDKKDDYIEFFYYRADKSLALPEYFRNARIYVAK